MKVNKRQGVSEGEGSALDRDTVGSQRHVERCAVSAVDYVACHAPKKEGAHYFGTAVKILSNIRTQTNKEILE